MDMIDAVMIEDAIKNYSMVEDAVAEVAMIVAELHNEFAGVESPRWRVGRFSFSKATAEREGQCSVTLEVDWYNRPKTERYGDPENDDDDHYISSRDMLHRTVTFPTRYLTTLGWRAEAEKTARERAMRMAELQIKHLESGIADAIERRESLETKLEEKRRIARGEF